MVFASATLAQSGDAYSVCCVDPCVHGEAGGGNEAAGFEFTGSSIGKLLCLAGVGADLGCPDWLGALGLRHETVRRSRRVVCRA